MLKETPKEGGTRLRVLESACEAFARHGFRGTTVADICQAAQANVAAVNYYFQNKRRLYREVWRHAQAVNDKAYGFDDADTASPELWLRAHLRNRIRSLFDDTPGGWFPKILQREMANPSDMTESLREEFLRPRLLQLERVIGALLGVGATTLQVRCCMLNVVSLHAFMNCGLLARELLFSGSHQDEASVTEVVRQVQEFALSAVKGVRRYIEEGEDS